MKIASIVCFVLGVAGIAGSISGSLTESLPPTILFLFLSLIFGLKSKSKKRHALSQKKELVNNLVSDLLITVSSDIPLPNHVYTDMRAGYKEMQVQNDIRILLDCYQMCQTSTNLETVIQRSELGSIKALTLQQASQVGICDVSQLSEVFEYFNGNNETIIIQSLYKCWEKQKGEIDLLKTSNGKKNRLKKFLDDMNRVLLPIIYDEDKIILYDDLLEAWRIIKSEAQEIEAAV
jgi:hypothetical protein